MKRWSGASLGVSLLLTVVGCVVEPTAPLAVGLTEPVELAYVLNDMVWVYDAKTEQHQAISVTSSSTNGASAALPALLPGGVGVIFEQVIGAQTTQPYNELWRYTLSTQTSDLLATHQTPITALRIAPNGQYVCYLVDETLYLTDLTTATTNRLHEGVVAVAWSPNSRRIVYATTDERVLVREFDVAGQLTEPEVLLEQAATALTFVDNHQLLLVGPHVNEYAVLLYNLNTTALTPVTSLRFNAPSSAAEKLWFDAKAERILYQRSDTNDAGVAQPMVWLLYLKKDVAKQLFTDGSDAIWSNIENEIYYQTLNPPAIVQSSSTGLNHTEFVVGGSAITSSHMLGSNE